VMLPAVTQPLTTWIASTALIALVYSFAVDVRWLWRS
jgi:hypothetical protein